jgi:hypothetical protein
LGSLGIGHRAGYLLDTLAKTMPTTGVRRSTQASSHLASWSTTRRSSSAYLNEVDRLLERDTRIEHVALDYELTREHQKWLHERDRGIPDADGSSTSFTRAI